MEPRFCETLQCFHHILKDMTLPESMIKQKAKPSKISVILAMSKTGPRRIFQDFMCNLGTISEHISQLIQASFSSTQKCKKSKSRSLCRAAYPRHITEEGGTRRHPGAQGASEGISLINRHHSHAKCKNFPRLIILLCVFEGPSRIHLYLLQKWGTTAVTAAGHPSRPL